ncbi:uncharacterized protein LOC128683277 [Plodia interpunctella]|uniref:uncharacterized protein LOC128683277 n=1 Tax=Plodia interpunctella TaxID=58824 RepID=UPI00236744A9|nr:uncharacterized protein LOC128683277 isoform X2 [Plodia interpunctella]
MTQTGKRSLGILLMGKALTIIMMSVAVHSRIADMQWQRWDWSEPNMENFFRRNPKMFIKTPQMHCECPPFKECEVEFQPNEDMIDFLHLRGVINETKAEEYKEDLKKISDSPEPSFKNKILERRRRMNRPEDDQKIDKAQNLEDREHCCCPPHSIMLPTFITDQKFDELVERIEDRYRSNRKNLQNGF